jgi:transcriptional regulator with XRE-family HTH domain
MNSSQAWVALALKTLSCSQKDLAQRVAVSPGQISKWKNGERMSLDMQDKFRVIVKIGEQHPDFVLWAGSLENAYKWEHLIRFLVEDAKGDAEAGYKTEPFDGDLGLLCRKVSDTFRDMGVEAPEGFPTDLGPYLNHRPDIKDDHGEELLDMVASNSYSSLIQAIFESLYSVWGFYTAYVMEVADDAGGELFAAKSNIEACMMDLAACKIEVHEGFAPKFRTFRRRVIMEYKEWLTAFQEAAFRAGTPLRAELLDLVRKDAEDPGEVESFGENDNRLHSDIYMNELLVGMRIIHQVLPVILRKLNIKDF